MIGLEMLLTLSVLLLCRRTGKCPGPSALRRACVMHPQAHHEWHGLEMIKHGAFVEAPMTTSTWNRAHRHPLRLYYPNGSATPDNRRYGHLKSF